MDRGFFSPHSYHVDIRFETGFTQLSELADCILEAIKRGKRVIIEHFELVYPLLKMNADLLVGVGEEVVIARPNVFGPEPYEVRDIVYASLPFRLKSHTAEDLCEMLLPEEDYKRCGHDDVRHGFAIYFPDTPPDIDIPALEAQVNAIIAENLPVGYVDDNHISVGDKIHKCNGPRIHVHRTGQIQNFRLMHHLIYDRFKKRYVLVGCVGEGSDKILERLDNQRQQPGWD
jgi:hypothetical protein